MVGRGGLVVGKYFPMENKISKPTCFIVFQCSYYFTLLLIRGILNMNEHFPMYNCATPKYVIPIKGKKRKILY